MARKIIFTFLLILLLYTRLLNLSWGLPYPFHPDERNMADSIMQLQCPYSAAIIVAQPKLCLNPHFFAYGQFPLYIAYFGIHFYHAALAMPITPITFSEAVLALRYIAALSSVILVITLFKIVCLIEEKVEKSMFWSTLIFLLLTAVPVGIQSAHFGTTESLLMAMEMGIIYLCMLLLKQKIHFFRFLFFSSILTGLAVGTKISAGIFVFPVIVAVCIRKKPLYIVLYGLISVIVFIVSSPHYFLSFADARSSLSYETTVATGSLLVFYTQQFFGSIPILFQFVRIFPYALGLPLFIFGLAGFFVLPRDRFYFLLRIVGLIAFLSQAYLYAKWSRFMAPVFPILLVFAALFAYRFMHWVWKQTKRNLVIRYVLYLCLAMSIGYSLIFGFAYLHIYQSEDIRFTASRWMVQNINPGAEILSETANVVDIPVLPIGEITPVRDYLHHSFDFYNLEESFVLQNSLQNILSSAEYILIPSRRIFANYTCSPLLNISLGYIPQRCAILASTYSKIQEYYITILGSSLYQPVAEFHRYPAIVIFGKTIVEFPDEQAEETWTVFDHPSIRILQKI